MGNSTAPLRRVFDAPAIGVLLGLSALLLAVYAGVGSHEFVDFDDYQYVVSNRSLDGQIGWDDLRNAFSKPYASNWAPIHSLSLALSDSSLSW